MAKRTSSKTEIKKMPQPRPAKPAQARKRSANGGDGHPPNHRAAGQTETRKDQTPPPGPDRPAAAPRGPANSTDGYRLNDPATFGQNMAQVAAKSQQLLGDF